MSKVSAVVADVGGTNARFAWCDDSASPQLHDIVRLKCTDYDDLADAFQAYCGQFGITTDRLSAALACPCEAETIDFTNNHWRFNKAELLTTLQLRELRTVNDFTAQSLAVPHIDSSDIVVLHPGEKVRAPILVTGPGTGLGAGVLVPMDNDWLPLVTEGGHVTVAAFNRTDAHVFEWLTKRFGHVSAERLISGPGLENIYSAEVAHNGAETENLSAAEITRRGIAGDALCERVLACFCRVFAVVVGNAVVTVGARGGVVISGGVIPHMLEFFRGSDFLSQLHDKGRFTDYLQRVPVSVAVADDSGLLGSAAALTNPHLDALGYVTTR